MLLLKRFILLVVLALVSCATTTDPLTGEKVYTLLPTEEEVKLGREYIPQSIAQGEGLYPDGETQEYLRQLGDRIAVHTPRRLPYRFYLLNSSAYNAFAIPGGGIFVTRGLLNLMEKESELVGVLAHELGHVNARHHARYLEKVVGVALLLQIASLVIADDKSTTDDIILQVAAIGAGLLTLKFSRDQEREADRLAVRFAVDSGYDPYALVGVFQKLKRAYKNTPPEWLSTHPLPDSRIKEVRSLIDSKGVPANLTQDSPAFYRIKERLKAHEGAYKAYEEGKKLLSKDRKEEALSKFLEAARLYDRFQMAYVFSASVLADLGRFEEALGYANRAVDLDPELLWTRFTKGYVLFRLGRYEESVRELEYAKRLVKAYADTYYYLGRDYEALGDFRKARENFETAIKLAGGKESWLVDARHRYNRYKRF